PEDAARACRRPGCRARPEDAARAWRRPACRARAEDAARAWRRAGLAGNRRWGTAGIAAEPAPTRRAAFAPVARASGFGFGGEPSITQPTANARTKAITTTPVREASSTAGCRGLPRRASRIT